jgi:hypothetical protein
MARQAERLALMGRLRPRARGGGGFRRTCKRCTGAPKVLGNLVHSHDPLLADFPRELMSVLEHATLLIDWLHTSVTGLGLTA